jgi:hypothetical protein
MGEKKGKRGSVEKEQDVGYPVFGPDDSRLVYEDYGNLHAKNISEQLAQKTSDLERLREYVTQLEEGERGLMQELTRQLAVKDEEVSRVAALYAKKEAENRKLSESFEAHVVSERENAEKIKSLLIKKERENSVNIETLKREIGAKDSEILSLQKSLISKSSNDTDFRRIQELLQSESISGSANARQKEQLLFMEKQVESLKSLVSAKDETVKKLRALLESETVGGSTQLRLKEQLSFMGEQVESLRSLVSEKDVTINKLEEAFDAKCTNVTSTLRLELEQKKEELKGLKRMLFEAQRKSPNSSMQVEHGFALKQVEALNQKVSDMNNENQELQRSFIEEQKLNKSVQERLRSQISSMSLQLEELKSLLIEKEKLLQGLENAFEKRIAAKEEELSELINESRNRPEPRFHRDVDNLKEELKIKEQSSQTLSEEVAKQKEQIGILHKRLEERQRIYSESEKAYELIIGRLREQHHARVSSLITESAQKEAAMKAGLESERSRVQNEARLMKEKEKQIEETIVSFTAISEQMLKLGTASLPGEEGSLISAKQELDKKGKELESRELELKELLSRAEEKINELKARESVVEGKEQLLFKQQEALNRQLDILNNVGIEIGKSKQYLENKLEGIASSSEKDDGQEFELPEFQEMPRAQHMAENKVNEEALHSSIDANKPSKSRPLAENIQLKPIKSVLKANIPPLRNEQQELFSEIGGYSETEEIKSIVEVGLQHGNSIDLIKESLIVSGYSRQNIEKVLNNFSKK